MTPNINSPTAKELATKSIVELSCIVYQNALAVKQMVDALDVENLGGIVTRAEAAAATAEADASSANESATAAETAAEDARAEADRARTYFENIVDLFLPVGSQISNKNVNFNPNDVYSGTTWVKVSGFLYGVTDNARVDETGGEETHTLTVSEMPNHRHDLPIKYTSGTRRGIGAWADDSILPTDGAYSSGYTGGGQAHNNMPPYKGTIIWERVA